MMATYNGEKWLSEQIDSILKQRGVDVTLQICDDRSTDGTFQVADAYQQEFDNIIATQNAENLGVGKNFMQMVYEVNAEDYDYFAFSDQDDVWLPEKLQVAIEKIEKAKKDDDLKTIEGVGTPILYCSDIQNVDENLKNPKRELASMQLDETLRATPLLRNWHSGCSFVFNRSMLKLCQKANVKDTFRNHDAWLYLIAFYCGNTIVDLQNALILRRLTSTNTVGEIAAGTDVKKAKVAHVAQQPKQNMKKCASVLYDEYKNYFSNSDRAMIESFLRYDSLLKERLKWVFSNSYASLSHADTLLLRAKLMLGRL